MRVEELMNRLPATCEPDDALREVERTMEGSNSAFLPVTAGDGSRRLVGVVTDGDIRMAAQLGGRSLEELRVRDVMAKEVRVCSPGDDLAEAEATVQEAGIRCLPVVDESGQLLGVLSPSEAPDEAEGEREALRAQISAASFGLVASRVQEPHRAGKAA